MTGFDGELVFDPGKPDGTPRKLLEVSRLLALGLVGTMAALVPYLVCNLDLGPAWHRRRLKRGREGVAPAVAALPTAGGGEGGRRRVQEDQAAAFMRKSTWIAS